MSETEYMTGKAILVSTNAEEFAKKLYEGKCSEVLPDYYDSYTEWMTDYVDGYVVVGGCVYEVLEIHEYDEYASIAKATSDGSGVVSFELKYYNGGTNFQEMFEKAIESMGNTKC